MHNKDKAVVGKIEQIPYLDIKEYKANPRRNAKALEALKRSIVEFGFNGAIWIDSKNVIVAGHTRYKALVELGYKEIPCIRLNLPPKKIDALRLVDNKVQELGEWDNDLLEAEIRKLGQIDFNMVDFGFDQSYIDSVFDTLNKVATTADTHIGSIKSIEPSDPIKLHEKNAISIEEAMESIQEREEGFENIDTIINSATQLHNKDAEEEKMSIIVCFKKDKLQKVLDLLEIKEYRRIVEIK